jgi:hypothetical protein
MIFPQRPNSSWSNIIIALLGAFGAKKNVHFIAARRASASLNFGNISAQNSSDLTIECEGVKVGDIVSVSPPVYNDHCCFTGFVETDGEITVRFNNYSAAPINPAAGVFYVTAVPTA